MAALPLPQCGKALPYRCRNIFAPGCAACALFSELARPGGVAARENPRLSVRPSLTALESGKAASRLHITRAWEVNAWFGFVLFRVKQPFVDAAHLRYIVPAKANAKVAGRIRELGIRRVSYVFQTLFSPGK